MKQFEKSKFEREVIRLVTEMRIRKGLSQTDIANIIEKSRVFVNQIENPYHKSKYNLNHINKLALYFNCSPTELIPDKGIEEDIKS